MARPRLSSIPSLPRSTASPRSATKAAQTAVDGGRAKDLALKDATAQKVAALQALAAAQDDAKSAVASAQANLAKVQAIPVLNVADAAKAIAALADKLQKAVT